MGAEVSCEKCGFSIGDGAKFCSGCGSELVTAPKFCHACGSDLVNATMTQQEIYEFVHEALENSIELWGLVDEEENPELYAFWRGSVTALEQIVDEITP